MAGSIISRNIQTCISRLLSCSTPPVGHRNGPSTPAGPDSLPSSPSSPSTAHPPAPSSDSEPPNSAAAADDDEYHPDISSALASRRLLPPSSPGRSNAIADSAAVAFGVGVATPTYSTDPRADFRRSMEEMAAATGLLGPPRSTDCRRRRRVRLYELLLCYLALNRRDAHSFIISAFADLLAAIAKEEDDDSGAG